MGPRGENPQPRGCPRTSGAVVLGPAVAGETRWEGESQRLPALSGRAIAAFRMPDTIAKSDPPSRLLMRLQREVLQRPLAAALGALALVSLVFLLAPGLDLTISRFFYASPAGFSGARNSILEALRDGGRIVEWAFALAVVAPLLIKVLVPQGRILLPPRASLFVLATFVLGPWLIVNGILKEFWGRARPRAILEFGGDAIYSPAWWISDQCERNCSFVSGEAASAFCLVALVFLVRKEWWPVVAATTLAFAATVSFTRIAAGGHFLSDVLIAWLVTLYVMIALHRMVLRGLPLAFDRSVEAAAGRSGEALRRLIRGRLPS